MSAPILAALGAILLWGTLAALGASLAHLPPFLLTGLAVRRVAPFSSWAIGGFAAASGALTLACHVLFESSAELASGDLARLAVLGLGPMGAAFYLWDYAMKRGDPRVIGTLAYATPVLSAGCSRSPPDAHGRGRSDSRRGSLRVPRRSRFGRASAVAEPPERQGRTYAYPCCWRCMSSTTPAGT